MNETRNPIKKLYYILNSWRPLPAYELVSYVFMFACVPMLAFGVKSYDFEILKIIILSVLTLYSGFFAALIWNDITDADIDKISHPDRPVPKGKISKIKFFSIALIFSAFTFIFAVVTSAWCLILVGTTALFVTFHNKYLKKKVDFPAYSEIFTPVQWLTVAVFGYLAIWTNFHLGNITFSFPILGYISFDAVGFQNMVLLVLFTYFADDAHDLSEGIHDIDGDRRMGVKTYATSFGQRIAAKISFVMFFISGILGILLFLRTSLSLIFLLPFLLNWLYILNRSHRLVKAKKENMKKLGSIFGRKGFNYLLISYNLIFLDLFLQVLNYNFTIF